MGSSVFRIIVAAGCASRCDAAVGLRWFATGILMQMEAMQARCEALQRGCEHQAQIRLSDGNVTNALTDTVLIHVMNGYDCVRQCCRSRYGQRQCEYFLHFYLLVLETAPKFLI